MFPVCTLPKLKLVGFVIKLPAATPVPVMAIFSGLPVASLVRATFPLTSPVDCGLKTMLKVALCPAVSVRGSVRPVTLKPLPVTPDGEMVTVVVPVLVIVSA